MQSTAELRVGTRVRAAQMRYRHYVGTVTETFDHAPYVRVVWDDDRGTALCMYHMLDKE